MKIETRFDHDAIPMGKSSMVHILVTLTAPEAPTAAPRPELNIAAVIDRSGSMAGKKLEYAKESVRILLDQLAPSDSFSLVAFDDKVLPLVEASRSADRTQEKAAVEQIGAGGSTNLSGGWIKGIELVSRNTRKDTVNAVLLLTDGQANRGITEPEKLVDIGGSTHKTKSIRTSCMGLGADFQEDLLRDIATASGGRFHYIESPDHAPEVFNEELGGLLTLVAQNVEVDLVFPDGVSGVAQLTGHPWSTSGNTSRLIIGDFCAGQVKHALLVVELPALTDLTDVLLASMEVKYAQVDKDQIRIASQKQKLVVGLHDPAEPEKPADPEVLLHIGIQRAAQARKDAVQRMDEGNMDGAAQVLETLRDEIRSLAGGTSQPDRLNTEADELDRRVKELRDRRKAMESRKFMVAEGTAMGQTNYGNIDAARKRRGRRDQA